MGLTSELTVSAPLTSPCWYADWSLARMSAFADYIHSKKHVSSKPISLSLSAPPHSFNTTSVEVTVSRLASKSVLLLLLTHPLTFTNSFISTLAVASRVPVLLCNCDDRGNTQATVPHSNSTGCGRNIATLSNQYKVNGNWVSVSSDASLHIQIVHFSGTFPVPGWRQKFAWHYTGD